MEKERLDLLVVQQGLTDSREKAKRLIMAGQIYDENNQRYDKPGEKISVEKTLHIKGETLKYVSRGGLKLEKAIALFQVNPKDKIFLAIGSSTGGFTDVALQNGAKLCYALDVGYNQLDWKLRQDERVEVMERVNFRYSKLEDFEKGRPEMASIDVSFISLKLILPVLKEIIAVGGDVVALIKPQFEAGRGKIGKKGIVSDPAVHNEVLRDILEFASLTGFDVKNLSFSPITGGTGNIEFLVHLEANDHAPGIISPEIDSQQVVKEAYLQLKSKSISISDK